MSIRPVAFALTIAVAAPAEELGTRGGTEPLTDRARVALAMENDLFTLGAWPTTDRFYTSGVHLAVEWSSPALERATRGLSREPFAPAELAHLGVGLSHELHTPDTLNPCQARYGDALTELPPGVRRSLCDAAERDWAENYARRDHPFFALWSVFLTAQRHYHRRVGRGALTQYRPWARVDLGAYGRGSGFGYELQKGWHSVFGDLLSSDGKAAAVDPTGWLSEGEGAPSSLLVQGSAGADLNLYRWASEAAGGRLAPGAEVDARVSVLAGVPRDRASVGVTARAGLLPAHSSRAPSPSGTGRLAAYAQASADVSAVAVDLTYGASDRYRHFPDEYAAGLHVKLVRVDVSASLHWQRLRFVHALQEYPSRERVGDAMHRYGRVAVAVGF